jgi:phage/plasmid primase-like uncharacterized protein
MSFAAFSRAHGLEIHDLHPSARIHRCPTTVHPRSRNGAYFYDGTHGWVQNWETGEGVQWWNDPAAKPWTDENKAQWAAQRRGAREARLRTQERAAAQAADLIAEASPETHGYLMAKGFPDTKGLVLPDGGLLIPMRDVATNALLGAQVVRLEENEWRKRMVPGMRAKGAVFVIGPRRSREFVLCEGYATGLSLNAAIRLLGLSISVMVCFSAHNLTHVAALTRGRRVVFADHDASCTGELAAMATGLPWVMSPVMGEDANDLHQRKGTLAVAKLLMQLRSTR